MDFYALRNKHNRLYISQSPASRMILSREPSMVCYFNEENMGEKIFKIFDALVSREDYPVVEREDYEVVEIILP